MRRHLIVTGSRSLANSPEKKRWSMGVLLDVVKSYDVVVHGGAIGPDLWAKSVAFSYGIPTVCFGLDGIVTEDIGRGQSLLTNWTTGEGLPEGQSYILPHHNQGVFPLLRNQVMVDSTLTGSHEVHLLALIDPESKTRGAGYTANYYRKRGGKFDMIRTYGEKT